MIEDQEFNIIYEFNNNDVFWRVNKNGPNEEMKISLFIGQRFKILDKQDEEKIDIQAIENIIFKREVNDNEMYLGDKIDELIKAVKQLDQNKEDK